MKRIVAVFLGLAIAVLSQFALAAPAIVVELVGAAQRIPDGAAPIALKKGDAVNERDTVQTGVDSGVVLRFEDGQVSTLGANTRMTVNAYTYDVKDPAKSNVLLSLLTGGMRAVTGLIGRARPDRVAFRAGTATIGIRGTDVTFAVAGGEVTVSVNAGTIEFSFGGQKVTIPVGQAALTAAGKITTGTIAAIQAAVAANPAMQNLLNSVNQPTLLKATEQAATASVQPISPTNPVVQTYQPVPDCAVVSCN